MIRFTAVLHLYEQEESAAKAELGRRERRRAELIAEREVIAAALAEAGRNVPTAMHELYFTYWRAEQARLKRQDQAIAAQEQSIAEARTALAAAHRKRVTIEKLRERDAHAAAKREDRREQRRNDDRAARGWSSSGTPTEMRGA